MGLLGLPRASLASMFGLFSGIHHDADDVWR